MYRYLFIAITLFSMSAHAELVKIEYGNAVHSFTIKGAGNDNSKGAAYNADADKRSWIALQNFFKETL